MTQPTDSAALARRLEANEIAAWRSIFQAPAPDVAAKLGLGYAEQAGALLIWNNMLPDGTPNPDVRHAALPVERGVKYVITKWFRTRPWG